MSEEMQLLMKINREVGEIKIKVEHIQVDVAELKRKRGFFKKVLYGIGALGAGVATILAKQFH